MLLVKRRAADYISPLYKELEKPMKVFSISILFAICMNSVVAYAEKNVADTGRESTLLAALDKKEDAVVVLKEANVIYPAIFEGNESESLDYIEKFSTQRKAYLIRTFNRSKKLFPKAVAILEKYNVPQEFKVLLALESGFNGNAVSSAGAVGYWQFMDEVAKEYGLKIASRKYLRSAKNKRSAKVNKKLVVKTGVDDRKNFNKSTHAAARYLKDRSRNLDNDWLLIAASYNCGVGNVWNAMQRSGKKSPTFWDIKNYLPAETRAYVMNFIAMNVIFENYEAFCRNELCFRDVTCKVETIEEQPGTQFSKSSIIE